MFFFFLLFMLICFFIFIIWITGVPSVEKLLLSESHLVCSSVQCRLPAEENLGSSQQVVFSDMKKFAKPVVQ